MRRKPWENSVVMVGLCSRYRLWLAVIAAASIGAFAPGENALARSEGATGRLVVIEGSWAPVSAPAEVIGTLRLVTEPGGAARSFAVTKVQAFLDAEDGMHVFRSASIRPALNVRGRRELISKLRNAPAGARVRVVAAFGSGAGELLVGDVLVGDRHE